MTYDFIFTQKVLDKTFRLREISFLEYRSLVKNILNDDIFVVEKAFDDLLSATLLDKKDLTVQEKFLLLLKYRELIHGKQLEFIADEIKVNYSIDNIFDFFNRELPYYEYEIDGDIYKFGLPSKMIPDKDYVINIVDSLKMINYEPVIDKNLCNLPALPLLEIRKKISEYFEPFKFKIQYIDYDVSLNDVSFLYFLKSIFIFDLQGLYDLEYALRKNLNFSINDLSQLSYPECNLMLKLFNKDVAEREKEENKVDSEN
jgi:hypothetical protein